MGEFENIVQESVREGVIPGLIIYADNCSGTSILILVFFHNGGHLH